MRSPPWLRGLAVTTLVSLALGLAPACEKDRAPPPSETCTKVAEQCKLPSGPLGICNSVACKAGETPPCLRCTPQH